MIKIKTIKKFNKIIREKVIDKSLKIVKTK